MSRGLWFSGIKKIGVLPSMVHGIVNILCTLTYIPSGKTGLSALLTMYISCMMVNLLIAQNLLLGFCVS